MANGSTSTRTAAAAGTSGGCRRTAPGQTIGNAQRVTNDDLEDWFPHPSPDGKWLLFLSFPHGTEGHNDRNQRIQIRMIPMPGETPHDERPQVIVELTGGQGTINVNSWSPDSRRFAFVSYQAKNEKAGGGTAK